MPKYTKIFIAIIATLICLSVCLMIISPIVSIFNGTVGLILVYITIGAVFGTMLVFVIFCAIGLVKLLLED